MDRTILAEATQLICFPNYVHETFFGPSLLEKDPHKEPNIPRKIYPDTTMFRKSIVGYPSYSGVKPSMAIKFPRQS